ncbi:hypothetical protein STEG23_009950, partial [Scotinomys teguina]
MDELKTKILYTLVQEGNLFRLVNVNFNDNVVEVTVPVLRFQSTRSAAQDETHRLSRWDILKCHRRDTYATRHDDQNEIKKNFLGWTMVPKRSRQQQLHKIEKPDSP